MKPIGLALSMLCLAGGAHAQPPAPAETNALPSDEELTILLESPTMTPQDAYELGVRLFGAERYEGAERAWTRSHALSPNPTLLIAIADIRQRRGDEPGTVAILERYLRERPDAPDKLAVEARIATLLETPATVVIRADEAGQAILVDGKPIDEKTPAEIELEPGMHTLIVVGDGQRVGEKSVQLGFGERKELDFNAAPESEVVEEAKAEDDFAREERTARRAVWALSGVAAAALLTGTVLGFTAFKQEQDYRNDPTLEIADKGERLALFADVSFGIAALSAVTALTVFLTTKNKKKRRERATARLRFETRGPGASATLRF
ncbi:MAG: PEGA domain-containing protein [Myxococcales bacterium]|nr:PEGA domain-containing protein [Myxococcales bacterium]MDH3485948.1 PEGA domain-containing protein [Myxococcales bacterium]